MILANGDAERFWCGVGCLGSVDATPALSAIREGNTLRLGTPKPFFPISNLPFFGP
jgi:hypothetical protein